MADWFTSEEFSTIENHSLRSLLGVEEEVPVPAIEVAEICEEPVDEKIEIVDEIEPDSDEEIEELVLSSEAEDEAGNKIRRPHHRGPFSAGFIEDKRKCGSYCKRSKTLMKLAKELHSITGADVELNIHNNDNKKCQRYNSKRIKRRTVGIQTGSSFINTKKRATRTRPTADQSPKKLRKLASTRLKASTSTSLSLHSRRPINNLPGIKTSTPTSTKQVGRGVNKCKICSIMNGSKIDLAKKKEFGKQNTWIGCEVESCNYWGHARCFEVTVKNVQTTPFKCPSHE